MKSQQSCCFDAIQPALHAGRFLQHNLPGHHCISYLLTPSARAKPEGVGEVSMASAWLAAVRGEGACCPMPPG